MYEIMDENVLKSISGGAGSSDGSKCKASRGKFKGNFDYCTSPNHQTVGEGYMANGGGCYRDRICLNCGAQWTEWLSNVTNEWEVWRFGEHSSHW